MFATHGVIAGDRVVIVAENGLAQVAAFFGASLLGAWPTLLNARASAREIDAIQSHAEPRIVAYTPGNSSDAAMHAARHGADVALDLANTPCARLVIGQTNPAVNPERGVAAEAVAALIYTSGTTGAPKGVMVTHAGLMSFAERSVAVRRLSDRDVVLGALPMSHIFGVATILLTTIRAAGCVWLQPRFDVDATVDALQRGGLSVLHGVPTLYRRLLTGIEAERLRGSVRGFALRLRGRRCARRSIEARRRARPRIATASRIRDDGVRGLHVCHACRSSANGYLARRTRARLRSALRGFERRGRGSRRAGEIWVRGPGTMLGYYRDPALTRETLTRDGWLRTGDVGYLLSDGALRIVSRARDIIKRSGFTVYPLEVEQQLAEHPAVRLAGVVGVPGPVGRGGNRRVRRNGRRGRACRADRIRTLAVVCLQVPATRRLRRGTAAHRQRQDSQADAARTLECAAMIVADRLFEHARETPTRPAYRDAARTIDFATAAQAVERIGVRLAALGLRPRDRILIVSENDIATPLLMLAAQRVGAWPAPVNARSGAAELVAMRACARPRLVVFATDASVAAAELAEREATQSWIDAACGSMRIARKVGFDTPAAVDSNVALLLFTSGTTGRAKAVMWSHEGLAELGRVLAASRATKAGSVVQCAGPLSHIMGISNFMAALAAGATLQLMPRLDVAALVTAIASGRDHALVARADGIPAALRPPETRGISLQGTGLRYISAGGAPLDPMLKQRVERLFGLRLVNGYGMTECAPGSRTRPDRDASASCIGWPEAGVEMKVDGDDTGELLIRSATRMVGYFGAAGETAAIVRPDGWLATGDLARRLPTARSSSSAAGKR